MSTTPHETASHAPTPARALAFYSRLDAQQQQPRSRRVVNNESQDDTQVESENTSVSIAGQTPTEVADNTSSNPNHPLRQPTTLPSSRDRSSVPSPYLRSLVEAAERIAQGPTHDFSGTSWMESGNPQPSRGGSQADRIRLTRQYSGRPHVPGEDSGSDSEDDAGMDAGRRFEEPQGQEDQSHAGRRQDRETRQLSSTPDIAGLMRFRDGAAAALASYSTTGPIPTQQSLHNWSPEMPRVMNAQDRQRRVSQVLARRSIDSARPANSGPRPNLSVLGDFNFDDSLNQPPEAPRTEQDARRESRNSANHGHDLDEAFSHYMSARQALRSQSQRLEDQDATREARNRNSGAPRRVWQSPRRFMVQPYQPSVASDSSGISNRTPGSPRRSTRESNDDRATGQSSLTIALSPEAANVPYPGDIRSLSLAEARSVAEHRRQAMERLRNMERDRRHAARSHAPNSDRRFLHSLLRPQSFLDDDDSVATGPLFSRGQATVMENPASQAGNGENAPRASSERYRRLTETYKRLKKSELELEPKSLRRAVATMQYLSRLRDLNRKPEQSENATWDLAGELGLRDESLRLDSRLDLPNSMTELPRVTYSSWLEAGIVWKGSQCAGTVDEGTRLLYARARRHRERMRREQDERDRNRDMYQAALSERLRIQHRMDEMIREQDELRREAQRHVQRQADLASQARSQIELDLSLASGDGISHLEDAERQLSEMLEFRREAMRNDRDWILNPTNETSGNPRSQTSYRERERERDREEEEMVAKGDELDGDRWNVKTTIHSVDWDEMTITGTMSASQLPSGPRLGYQRLSSNENGQPADGDSSCMDSFFTGEIIDFRRHTLETLPTSSLEQRNRKSDMKPGSRATELSYWAGLGPFRKEIDKQSNIRRAEKGLPKGEEKYCGDILGEEEKNEIRNEVMARMLGDKKTLNKEMEQWIFMRWKGMTIFAFSPFV